MLAIIPDFTVGTTGLMAIVLFMSSIALLIVLLASLVYVVSVNAAGTSPWVDIGLSIVGYVVGKLWMTSRLPMLVLYSGIGGAAAAAIAAAVLFGTRAAGVTQLLAALVGGLIGIVSLSGSLIAWAKLNGIIGRPMLMRGQQVSCLVVLAMTLAAGCYIVCTAQDGADRLTGTPGLTFLLLGLVVLVFGALLTLPVDEAQMPVAISICNALAGLAIGVEGFALQSPTLMAAGGVVGTARMALTLLMVTHGANKSVPVLGGTGPSGHVAW